MNRSFRNRRGVTSVIAMLFLVLIGTLALGFYTSVTTATALARNDQRTAKALMAAESGIQFMRNRLANVTIPPNTTSENLLNELWTDLKDDQKILGNLLGAPITYDGSIITIPFICTDANPLENTGFTVTISDIGSVGEIVCTVRGRIGTGAAVATKGVRLDFTREEVESTVFDSAIATKGTLVVESGTSITGIEGVSSDEIIKLMSTKKTMPAINMTGGTIGSSAGGELGIVVPSTSDPTKPNQAYANISNGTVHGTKNLTTIRGQHLKLVAEPEFPTVNTSVFQAYATNEYTSANATGGVLKNVRIPAGTNPSFTGNVTIQGILYIESPNTVNFAGNTNMQGFIVFENAGTSSQNIIDARGNFSYGNLPDDDEFDQLRTITGISMLAPTASVRLSGSLESQVRGNMILGNIQIGGSADLQVEKGSIITMDENATSALFSGKSVKFASTGMAYPPSLGVNYTSKFIPTKGSYLELN